MFDNHVWIREEEQKEKRNGKSPILSLKALGVATIVIKINEIVFKKSS